MASANAALDPTGAQAIVAQMVSELLGENGVADVDDATWQITDISWSTDPDDWMAARAALADLIEGN